jgi:hypothetical protein
MDFRKNINSWHALQVLTTPFFNFQPAHSCCNTVKALRFEIFAKSNIDVEVTFVLISKDVFYRILGQNVNVHRTVQDIFAKVIRSQFYAVYTYIYEGIPNKLCNQFWLGKFNRKGDNGILEASKESSECENMTVKETLLF